LRMLEHDIVFVTGPVEEPGLESVVIREEPLFLYGPAGGDPTAGDWVLYPGSSRTRGVIDRYFVDEGFTPQIILESANPAVLTQMVVLGFGWTILPEAVAEAGREPLTKHRAEPVAHRLMAAVWRASAAGNPRLAAFRTAALAA
ncbi:MAG: LysR family transcriptional regulator substrate-binding protein, partial [Acidimicrobiia bacterium]|nr:LysR family transcriptional regulator substrate-binding protein [Acidimicrobiia bacterium]